MTQDLEARLSDTANFLDEMLNLVNPKFYFPGELSQEAMLSSVFKGKQRALSKKQLKEQRKNRIPDHIKRKNKLDPANYRTVREIQTERLKAGLGTKIPDDDEETKSNNTTNASAPRGKKRPREDESKTSSKPATTGGDKPQANGADGESHADADADAAEEQQRGAGFGFLTLGGRAQTPEELKARLMAKLKQMEEQRGGKLSAKDKKKLTSNERRTLKELKKEEDAKKAKLRGSRKGKEPKAERIAKQKREDDDGEDGGDEVVPPPKKVKTEVKKEKKQEEDAEDGGGEGDKAGKKKKKKKAENLQFGTFEFSSGKPTPTYLLAKRKRDPKEKLLAKALHEQEKAKELAGTEEGKRLEEKRGWDKAFLKARGEKVLDDAALLAKSVKQKQKKKEKSRKAWDARKEAEETRKNAQQQKRSENIAEYLAKKKEKRMTKGKKKSRPGFEGKKKDFITQ